MNLSNVLIYMDNLSFSDINNLKKGHSNELTINNVTFHLLGKGGEGIVYVIMNDQTAMKIYKNPKSANNEINILKKCNVLLTNNVTNVFLKIYNVIKKIDTDIVIMELADGSFEHWATEKHSDMEWLIMIYQILVGVFLMAHVLKFYHSDMKPKNILFKKIPAKTFEFVIKNDSKTIRTKFKSEYVVKISDFGHAKLLQSDKTIQKMLDNNKDLTHVAIFHIRILVTMIEKIYTIQNLIDMGKDVNDFDQYITKEKGIIEKEMGHFDKRMKDKMLTRSLIYFLIENNKFDFNDVPNTTKYKLPSAEIINVLGSLVSLEGKEKLLDKINEIGLMINDDTLIPDEQFVVST